MASSTNVKGRTSAVASRRAMLVPSPARVAKVATISRSLRHETARPKRVNASRRAPAVQVETAWNRMVASHSSGESTSTEVRLCSAASRRRAAGVRAAQDQPEHGVERGRRRRRRGREGPGFGQRRAAGRRPPVPAGRVRGPAGARLETRRSAATWGESGSGLRPAARRVASTMPMAASMRATRVARSRTSPSSASNSGCDTATSSGFMGLAFRPRGQDFHQGRQR